MECFSNLTTGLSDEGRGQVEPSTHNIDGEQRDEVHEQLGVTVLHDLSECPCADRMVLFQACVA